MRTPEAQTLKDYNNGAGIKILSMQVQAQFVLSHGAETCSVFKKASHVKKKMAEYKMSRKRNLLNTYQFSGESHYLCHILPLLKVHPLNIKPITSVHTCIKT